MLLRGQLRLALAFGAALALGCARVNAPRGSFPQESISVPADVDLYTSEARPDGAVGGPGVLRVQNEISAALRERGEHAEADGALSATASWALREVHGNRPVDLIGVDAASRHFGYGGVVTAFMVLDAQSEQDFQQLLSTVPRNVPITRYGIRVSPSGRSFAVIFGSMEVGYSPIARAFEPGQSVNLKGEVAQRFKACELFLTRPDGGVEKQSLSGRAFDATFELKSPGVYRLEVMGDGPSGPVIASVVPLYVGVPEPAATGVVGTVVDADEAEKRMLVLLNEARRAAGISPVAADDELREIALGHSTDMADHHFFGHVSPTTGSPGDRARHAGIVVSMFGENVAAAATPEVAHEGLMNSPGHRANMLEPRFTHVGIAARKNESGLVVTMNFGRRPGPSALPSSAAQVAAALSALRASKGLAAVSEDPVYRVAAEAGAFAFAAGEDQSAINQAVDKALQREANRLHVGRPVSCTTTVELLELSQLAELPALVLPTLRRFGLGAHLRKDEKGNRLSTMFILEGVPCN